MWITRALVTDLRTTSDLMQRAAIGVVLILYSCICFIPTSLAEDDESASGRKYALLIGVQNYEGTGLSNLRFCENDVTALGEILETKSYGYNRITVLTRSQAMKNLDRDDILPTADNIRSHIGGLLKNRKQSDTIVIALAGHGVQLKGDGKMYFCPARCKLDNPATLIPLDEIYAGLKDCRANFKMLLVDACRNDPLDSRSSNSEKLESLSRPLVPDPPGGTVAIFSCSKGQTARENPKHGHGYLFKCLVEGLKGNSHTINPKTGEVSWLRLASFVSDEVRDNVQNDYGPNIYQIPEIRGESRNLILGKHSINTSSVAAVTFQHADLKAISVLRNANTEAAENGDLTAAAALIDYNFYTMWTVNTQKLQATIRNNPNAMIGKKTAQQIIEIIKLNQLYQTLSRVENSASVREQIAQCRNNIEALGTNDISVKRELGYAWLFFEPQDSVKGKRYLQEYIKMSEDIEDPALRRVLKIQRASALCAMAETSDEFEKTVRLCKESFKDLESDNIYLGFAHSLYSRLHTAKSYAASDVTVAKQFSTSAIKLFETSDYTDFLRSELQALALLYRPDIFPRDGDWNKSLEIYKKAEALVDQSETRTLAMSKWLTGYTTTGETNLQSRIRILKEADRLAIQAEDPIIRGDALYNLGIAYMQQKQWETSRAYFKKSSEVYKITKNEHWLAWSLFQIGGCESPNIGKLGSFEDASEYFEDALGRFRKLQNKQGVAWASFNLAVMKCEGGRIRSAEAKELFEECVETYREMNDHKSADNVERTWIRR